MLNTRKILYWAVTAVCCGLLPCGCVKEDAASLGERHDVAVRLNVGTCAVGETDGTPTGEESAIHSLRVYAFVKGQLAGHEFRSGDMETPATFWMDLTMTSLTTETVDFYIIANEKAMSTPGAEKTFTENTTEAELNDFTFTTLTRDVQAYGLPMFGKESKTIDFSKLSNRQPIDPGSILVMTYTVAATQELRARFAALFPQLSGRTPQFRTINGLSAKIIESCSRLRGPAFTLQENEGELAALVGRICLELHGEYPTDATVREIRTAITYCKNMMLGADEIRAQHFDVPGFFTIYTRYCQALRAARQMDYDDQMTYALAILRKHPDVLAQFQTQKSEAKRS